MSVTWKMCFVAVLLLTGSGCGGGPEAVPPADSGGGPDLAAETAAEIPGGMEPEAVSVEAREERPADLAGEGGGELVEQCPPDALCFGDPCSQNPDCLSGFCLQHMGDLVCSKECVEDCPPGWSCLEAPGSGTDSVFVCQSNFPTLCRPCATDEDCKSLAGEPKECVRLAGGSFCSQACDDKNPCPDGHECSGAQDVEGAGLMACIPTDGQCECSQYSIAKAFSTPCEEGNEFGLCTGERVCTAGGLSECSAAVPSFEVCNGADDDCSGAVDDEACSDDNPCTLDTCDPATGCTFQSLDASPCDDGDLCTLTDHCEEGDCVGTAIVCDDSNLCTDDSCDGQQGCVFAPNDDACDDGNACTVGDACSKGKCAGVAIDCQCKTDADCAPFDDGDVCNGTLLCDLAASPWSCKPKPGSAVVCPPPAGPDAQCLKAACDKQTGQCSTQPGPAGACDDGDACTFGESCAAGKCVGGLPVNCNDGNVCTTDSCIEGEGCAYADNTKACEDGNLCTVNDKCGGGKCLAGLPMDCEDGNACTDDSCNPLLGCVHTNNATECDDLDPCTTKSQCSGGMCVGTGLKDCADSNPCTDDMCLPMLGCDHKNNSNPCDDGDLCSSPDKCVAGMCVPGPEVTCEDKNPCTEDLCLANQGCLFTPNKKACNDGNPCTTGDQCSNGLCLGTAAADCDDKNVCTKDVCLPNGGCQHDPADGLPCTDGDACTTDDQCKAGKCAGGPKPDCDDKNPCTDDSCDAAKGCVHANNALPCDDLNACTDGDSCGQGACQPGKAIDCDDKNVCTTDTCLPADGCVHSLNTAPCNDGNLCTTDDHCQLGSCVGGGGLACADANPCTNDSCDPKAGCQFIPNQAACDDANACTIDEKCEAGKCVPKAVLACGDANLCTDDFCDPATGCGHLPNQNPCDDKNLCTTADVCTAGQCAGSGQLNCVDSNPCTDGSCDPVKGCVQTNNAAKCDDGNACTVTDLCQDGKCTGSGVPDCDDKTLCTDDQCTPGAGCTHSNNTVPCDDGNPCTENDKCGSGSCKAGTPKVCDDGNPCTQDSCDPAKGGCVFAGGGTCCGNGSIEAGEECDDGNTVNGDTCSNACKFTGSPFSSYSHSGRKVFIFKSNSNTPINQYDKFCEGLGLKWFVPKNQSDAQNLVTYSYNLDSYHTWIITKNTTTAGTFGGYGVTVDDPGCVAYSNTGFSAIRKWACSYCEPDSHGFTKCWDGHSYDWLVCEGGA
jgi:cysteine-rich repeat protein